MGCCSSKKATRKEPPAVPEEAPSTSSPVEESRLEELRDSSAVLYAPVVLPSVSTWTQALTKGASRGETQLVLKLLKERDGSSAPGRTCAVPDVDCVDGEGWTPLMWAARNGHTDIVKALLAHGAHPDVIKCGESWTALMFTVHKGHEEATKQLLNAGADVNFLSGFWTPISLAARMGNLSILKLLLKQGADPLLAGGNGWNALHHASRAGQREAVRTLLHASCPPDRLSVDQWPAVALAAHHGHTAVVNALLASPDVDVSMELGDNDFSLLMLAAHAGAADTLSSLVDKGGAVNSQTVDGWTALMFGALFGHEQVVKLLIKAGATLSPFTYKDRQTALLLACTHSSGKQHTEVTKALLAAGAAVEYGGQADMTPLITATHYGNATIVELLISYGADYNKPDSDGSTPIMRAAFLGHEAVTQLLLREPRDFEAAKMWAQKGGRMSVVDLVHAEATRRNIQLEQ